MNLKLVAYDRLEIIYEYKKLRVVGRQDYRNSFKFYFPERPFTNKIKLTTYKGYVLSEYKIEMGEDVDIHTFAKEIAKNELEKVLEKELKSSDNRRILIDLLFNDLAHIVRSRQ